MSVSWEEFVAKHAQAVLDSALRVVAIPADAEDVAQEVFLEIFRNKRLSEFAEQPALLRTMATRRALDRLRKRKPTYELDGRELDTQGHDPSEYAMAAELDKRLRDGLAGLPLKEAEVFAWSHLRAAPFRRFPDYLTSPKVQWLSHCARRAAACRRLWELSEPRSDNE